MCPNMCDGFGCSSSTGPFEPNAYGTFEGTRNGKGGRLDVDSSGADHKHSSKARCEGGWEAQGYDAQERSIQAKESARNQCEEKQVEADRELAVLSNERDE